MIITLVSTSAATPTQLKNLKIKKDRMVEVKETITQLIRIIKEAKEMYQEDLAEGDRSREASYKRNIKRFEAKLAGCKKRLPALRKQIAELESKKLSSNSSSNGMLESSPAIIELVSQLYDEQGTASARNIFKQIMGFAPKAGSQVGYGSSFVNRNDAGGWIFMVYRGHQIMLVEPNTPSLDKQLFVKRKPGEYLVYVDRNIKGGPTDGYINPVPGTILRLSNENSIKSYFKTMMTADYADIENTFREVNTDPAGQQMLNAWDKNLD